MRTGSVGWRMKGSSIPRNSCNALTRYATLVAYLLDMTATLTDTALEMHDHIMSLLFKQGQKKHLAQFEQRGKAINEKVRLYADVGNALIKAKEEAADPYQALEAVLLMA